MSTPRPCPVSTKPNGDLRRPIDKVVDALRAAKLDPVKCRDGWKSRCPAHDDEQASLDVKVGRDGKVLVICRSHGCLFPAIAAALNLDETDFFPHSIAPAKKSNRRTDFTHPVATYTYENPDGSPRFQVRRFNVFEDGHLVGKDFRQYLPDGTAGLGDVEPILYRLPELLVADPGRPVWVCEGEKDADNIRSLGRVATCNPMGAGKWRDSYAESLRGRTCWIIPDHDQVGHDHALKVAQSLLGIAASVKIVDLIQLMPDLPAKGDVSDFMELGGTLSQIEEHARGIPTFEKAVVLTVLTAPPREGQDQEQDEAWNELCLEEPPKVLPFPVEVFPVPLQRYCRGVARVTLTPPDVPGIAMLAVSSAAIGQTAQIRLRRTWKESALLNIVVVADPGKRKSPVITLVGAPLSKIDARLRDESKAAHDLWEAQKKSLGKGETAPEEPVQRRAIVKDVTRETLAAILRDNPRGVLADPDEATAWVSSFNEYKAKGSDRQFWLSIWQSKSLSVDRDGGRRSIYVRSPFVTVVAGIPPDMLSSLDEQHGRNDGFRDRILFAFPDEYPKKRWHEEELDQGDEITWAAVIGDMHGQDMFREPTGELRPYLIEFEREAKEEFIRWFDAHQEEAENPDMSAACAGIWSKLEAYGCRFMLILSRLRIGMDPEGDLIRSPIALSDVQGAVKLLDYFKSNARRMVHQLTGGTSDLNAKAIIGWIGRKKNASFSIRDLRQDMPSRFPTVASASYSVAILERKGLVRPTKSQPRPAKGGRKPSPTYDVHPDLIIQ